MRKISDSLLNHINSEVTTLCSCIRIENKFGKILGFTDFSNDLFIGNLLYKSSHGFNITSITSSGDLSAESFHIEMLFENSNKEFDLSIYDYGFVNIYTVNYNDPASGFINQAFGYIGDINIGNGKFSFEVRSVTEKLDKLIGSLYSPTCRAKFGDSKCKVDRGSYSRVGKVSKIINTYSFYDEQRDESLGYYDLGVVEFKKADIKLEIKNFSNRKIELFLTIPESVHVGDDYIIIPGCDKLLKTCIKKYNNILNFRGEPHIPGDKYILNN